MRLHNKFIMLSNKDMKAIKEGNEDVIPSDKLQIAKEWLANLKASQEGSKPKKDKPKKEEKQILKDKEILENGEN